MEERRKSPRVACQGQAYLMDLEAVESDYFPPEFEAVVENISENGLCLRSGSPIVPAGRLHVRLVLPDGRTVNSRVYIEWAKPPLGPDGICKAGASVIGILEEDQVVLNDFIRGRLAA